MNSCPQAICSHSLSTRLSRKLAVFTMLVLGALFAVTWGMVKDMLVERNAADLKARCELISDIVSHAAGGGEAAVLAQLLSDAPMRANTRLEVWRADGSLLYADAASDALRQSSHTQADDFVIATPALAGGRVQARYTVDYARDAAMGRRWAWILVGVTLAAGALVSAGTRWHVKRGLNPLRDLAAQTRAISARHLDRRGHVHVDRRSLLPLALQTRRDPIQQVLDPRQRTLEAYLRITRLLCDLSRSFHCPRRLIGDGQRSIRLLLGLLFVDNESHAVLVHMALRPAGNPDVLLRQRDHVHGDFRPGCLRLEIRQAVDDEGDDKDEY